MIPAGSLGLPFRSSLSSTSLWLVLQMVRCCSTASGMDVLCACVLWRQALHPAHVLHKDCWSRCDAHWQPISKLYFLAKIWRWGGNPRSRSFNNNNNRFRHNNNRLRQRKSVAPSVHGHIVQLDFMHLKVSEGYYWSDAARLWLRGLCQSVGQAMSPPDLKTDLHCSMCREVGCVAEKCQPAVTKGDFDSLEASSP